MVVAGSYRNRGKGKDPYDDEVDEVREGVDQRDQEERQQARDANLAKHIDNDVSIAIAQGSAGRGRSGEKEAERLTISWDGMGCWRMDRPPWL
jgi:hypothetical protein